MTLQTSQANNQAYSRPKPPEWDRLNEVAGIVTSLQDPEWDKPVLLSELGLEIDTLSPLGIFNNRYYAYGHMVCEFAKLVSDPDTREEIVVDGAKELVEQSDYARRGGICSFNDGFDLAIPYKNILDKSYSATATPIKLISNYIDTAMNHGVHLVEDRSATSTPTTSLTAKQMRGESMPNARFALDSITVAPQYIISEVLLNRGIRIREGQVPDEEEIQKLRDESMVRVAKKLCAVTAEQSLGQKGPIIKANDKNIEVHPHVKHSTVFAHIARGNQDELLIGEVMQTPKVCPALHVKGVIPMVMVMTVDMIDEARQMLEAA